MDIIRFRTVKFKNGAQAYKPTYAQHACADLAEVVRIRRFAEKAGIRSAAKALRNEGCPLGLATMILLGSTQDALWAQFARNNG